MIGMINGSSPHGDQFVADVIDQNSVATSHTIRKFFHDVADPSEGAGRAQSFADATETTDITKKHRNIGVFAGQHVGLRLDLADHFRSEGLLEADSGGHRFALLIQTR